MPQYAFELPEALVQDAQRDGSPAHAREPAEGERTKRSMTL